MDEIQKVPALLDEVHWMIENMGLRIAAAPKFYFADVGVVNVLTHRRTADGVEVLPEGEFAQRLWARSLSRTR
jgi:hypothetical protein